MVGSSTLSNPPGLVTFFGMKFYRALGSGHLGPFLLRSDQANHYLCVVGLHQNLAWAWD